MLSGEIEPMRQSRYRCFGQCHDAGIDANMRGLLAPFADAGDPTRPPVSADVGEDAVADIRQF